MVETQRIFVVTRSMECIGNDPEKVFVVPYQSVGAMIVRFEHLEVVLVLLVTRRHSANSAYHGFWEVIRAFT